MGAQDLARTIDALKKSNVVFAGTVLDKSHCILNGKVYPMKSTIPTFLNKGKRVYIVICENKAIVVGA